MSRNAWFPFYQQDWLSGVQFLTAAERGVYMTLLCWMYDKGGPVDVSDTSRVAAGCGVDRRTLPGILKRLIEHGKITLLEGGKITNPRAMREINVAAAKMSQKCHSEPKAGEQSCGNPETSLRQNCHGNDEAIRDAGARARDNHNHNHIPPDGGTRDKRAPPHQKNKENERKKAGKRRYFCPIDRDPDGYIRARDPLGRGFAVFNDDGSRTFTKGSGIAGQTPEEAAMMAEQVANFLGVEHDQPRQPPLN